jgi:hypothetical protein
MAKELTRNDAIKLAFQTYKRLMTIYSLFLPLLGSVIAAIWWFITKEIRIGMMIFTGICFGLGLLMTWASLTRLKRVRKAFKPYYEDPSKKLVYKYNGQKMDLLIGKEFIPYPRFMANKNIKALYAYLKEHGQKK